MRFSDLDLTDSSQLYIVSGPSKEELSLALFSQNDEIILQTADAETVMLHVASVERTDSSGERFYIAAYVRPPYGTRDIKVALNYETGKCAGWLMLRED